MRTVTYMTLVALFFLSDVAEARDGRQNQVPRGNDFGCDICHTQPGNGLNDFGFDSYTYTQNGNVQWSAEFAALDSDRDGYSNGEELGDIMGAWRPGDGDPGGTFTHPGDPDDGLCGNGSFEGAEECEGSDLGDATCENLGLVGGVLACDSTCRYDTSGCTSCGDGTLQDGEDCDGSDLGGATCASLGMGEGTLTCAGCRYDTFGCEGGGGGDDGPSTPVTCGNGVLERGEDCDVYDLGTATCATLGYDGGVLGCEVRCTYDTSQCIGEPPEPEMPQTGEPEGPTDSPGGGGNLDSGDEMKIVAEGRACSTAPAGVTDAWVLLLALIASRVRRRR